MARRRATARVVVLGVFLAVTLTAGLVALACGWIRPEMIQQTVTHAGAWGMVVYVAGVVVLELLWIPRAWGLVAGGVLFGPLTGCILSFVADMIGATLCYLIARGSGREWAVRAIEKHERAARIVDMLVRRRGGVTIGVLRVMPVAHYTLVSYAAGLSGVRMVPFLVGNAVGLVPGAVLYPLVGDAALTPTSPVFIVSVAVLVAAFLASAWWARRFLDRTREGDGERGQEKSRTGRNGSGG